MSLEVKTGKARGATTGFPAMAAPGLILEAKKSHAALKARRHGYMVA
jgi:hypothetical protein